MDESDAAPARHRREQMAPGDETPWSGIGGFVVWRARQLLSFRAWRLYVGAVFVVLLLTYGVAERDVSALAVGGTWLLLLVLWFGAPPILADGVTQIAHVVRARFRRS